MRAEKVHADELIGEIDRVRRRSRALASVMWFPLLLFGALSIVSAFIIARYGGEALGPYWMIAGPAGGVATGIAALGRGRRVGVEVPGGPYVAIAVLILIGASMAGWAGDALGERAVSAAGPPLVVSLGYVLFARLERSRPLAWTAGGLAALTVALLAAGIGPEPMAIILALVYGAAFVITGLFSLGRRW